MILLGVAIIFQLFLLFRYIDRTNRLLNNFLESIRYSEFTKTFQVNSNDSTLDKLKRSFNDVIKDFQEVRAEKEEHYFYLQTIIQHIGIALIAYTKDGTIELTNNAATKLFQLRVINNIQALKSVSPALVRCLLSIKNGENSLVRIQEKDDLLQLAVYATEFNIHNRTITLVSIKNIQPELDENEMESWQKLIQVLTHEIMNSIAPISSLSSTISGITEELSTSLKSKGIDNNDQQTIEEIEQALQIIHNRTDGLIHFVNTYRSLTKIPKPIFSIISAKTIFSNIKALLNDELSEKNIDLQISIKPESLEFSADEKLIEQVLLNLLKNAIHALETKENGSIQLNGYLNKRGRATIQISDNGHGILPNVLEQIFIPFFSTKPQGNGIGLSLSRQIMRLHGGSITAFSIPEEETKFTLTF